MGIRACGEGGGGLNRGEKNKYNNIFSYLICKEIFGPTLSVWAVLGPRSSGPASRRLQASSLLEELCVNLTKREREVRVSLLRLEPLRPEPGDGGMVLSLKRNKTRKTKIVLLFL